MHHAACGGMHMGGAGGGDDPNKGRRPLRSGHHDSGFYRELASDDDTESDPEADGEVKPRAQKVATKALGAKRQKHGLKTKAADAMRIAAGGSKNLPIALQRQVGWPSALNKVAINRERTKNGSRKPRSCYAQGKHRLCENADHGELGSRSMRRCPWCFGQALAAGLERSPIVFEFCASCVTVAGTPKQKHRCGCPKKAKP